MSHLQISTHAHEIASGDMDGCGDEDRQYPEPQVSVYVAFIGTRKFYARSAKFFRDKMHKIASHNYVYKFQTCSKFQTKVTSGDMADVTVLFTSVKQFSTTTSLQRRLWKEKDVWIVVVDRESEFQHTSDISHFVCNNRSGYQFLMLSCLVDAVNCYLTEGEKRVPQYFY